MPSLRLHPLLIAGAACLALAACGGDDDPPPQASAPAQTEPAAPAQTPTTTAPDPAAPADGNGPADEAEKPSDTPATTPAETSTTPRSDGDAGSAATEKNGPSPRSSDDSGDTVSEALRVREALLALQLAFAAKDGKKACSHMIGVPEKSADPKNPGISCELLSQGEKTRLSEQDRAAVATAKVKINGNEASAELGPGVPMTLRKIDGRWRVDYTEMAKPAGASG